MDVFLLILGFLLTLLGIIGSFLPILPGPITGWFGLLLLHLTKVVPLLTRRKRGNEHKTKMPPIWDGPDDGFKVWRKENE